MSDATIIIVVNVLCATALAALNLWLRRDLNTLRPVVLSVRDELMATKNLLVDANKFIDAQITKNQALRDEIAELTKGRYSE